MNAQKKLDDAAATIRNLTIERDALKAKCEVQRKALAHEAMETVKLRDALRNLLAWTDGQEHLHGLTDSGKQKYRADVQHAKEVVK